MTRHAAPEPLPGRNDAGEQVAQLRHLLGLIEEVAGRTSAQGGDAALDEAARISGAYEAATPLAQRRFDALAAETAGWSAEAVEALLAPGGPSAAAAARLADELGAALCQIGRLLD